MMPSSIERVAFGVRCPEQFISTFPSVCWMVSGTCLDLQTGTAQNQLTGKSKCLGLSNWQASVQKEMQ